MISALSRKIRCWSADLLRDRCGQRKNLSEHGIELLVEIATDDTDRFACFPAIGQDTIELANVLAQEMQVVPGFGQRGDLPEGRRAAVNGRADQELRSLYLRAHVFIEADVAIAAERLFEPEMRRRDFLLHRLQQAHVGRVALEVLRDEPLRINDDGNRNEPDGNDADDEILQRKRSRAQLHPILCVLNRRVGVAAAVIGAFILLVISKTNANIVPTSGIQ